MCRCRESERRASTTISENNAGLNDLKHIRMQKHPKHQFVFFTENRGQKTKPDQFTHLYEIVQLVSTLILLPTFGKKSSERS